MAYTIAMDTPKIIRVEDKDGWRWYEDKAGKRYASVTNILDVAVSQHLAKWYKSNSQNAIKKKVDASRKHGTAIHSLIEKDITGAEVVADPEHIKHLNSWQELKQKHIITCKHAEHLVVSELHGYAGTVDIIGMFEGKPCVMDIKTGRSYNIKTGWQMAAYKWAYEESTGTEGLGMVGLHIPSDGGPAKAFEYEHYDWCFERFLDCLGAFKGLYFNKLNSVAWPWLHTGREGRNETNNK